MSEINGISATLIENYINFNSKDKITTDDMFKQLSIAMGGDGSKITKDQLNNYIEDAESGSNKISDSQLNALKEIQSNWDTISGGKDSITASDMKDYSKLLLSAVFNDNTSSSSSSSASSSAETSKIDTTSTSSATTKTSPTDQVYSYLIQSAGLSSSSEISKTDLTNYLNDLLKGTKDTNDDANSNTIDLLTILIANYDNSGAVNFQV